MSSVFDGGIIKNMRKERHISQKKLAEMAGISNTYLSDLEVGRTSPSLKTLINISKALDISVDVLLKANDKSINEKE